MRSKISQCVIAVLCLVLAACGARQNLMQDGPTAISWADAPITFMRDTPKPAPRPCPISMLMDVKYLEEQTWAWYRADKWFSDEKPNQFFKSCPDKHMDPNSPIKLATWDPIGLEWSPSPFRVVAPGVIQGLGFVAAAGTLGATMPGAQVMQNQTASPFGGSHISTQYINGQVPAWLQGK